MKRKIAAILSIITAVACLTACGGGEGEKSASVPKDMQEPLAGFTAYRPKTISLMVDTAMTWEDGLQKVLDEYKAKTGITLKVEKPDHDKYYEKVEEAFAAGTPCDVMEMSGTHYSSFAASGKLWDMSHAWEISKFNTDDVDKSYIDANLINGKLYGFPLTKGRGSITYVRNDILKKEGKQAPTNYTEFVEMLRSFKSNGLIPFTASGFVNSDVPYNIYLPEFYQGANPDFVLKNGQYVDGMTEPEMKAALERMRAAYAEGLFDPETLTNKSSAVRDKISDGSAGSTNYWEGYSEKFNKQVKKKNPDYEVVAIKPIAEATYIKRQSINYVINNEFSGSDDRKTGIFEYFIGYSHDGGEGQLLFTKGVEKVHWNRDEQGVLDVVDAKKAFFDDDSSFVGKYNDYENAKHNESNRADNAILETKSVIAPVSMMTAETVDVVPEIAEARKKAINDIVTGVCGVDEGLAKYTEAVGEKVKNCLTYFNG